ncbi:MAG TPA: gamma-glutamylcyclotransferase family protein [Clostridiaceae bacterium]
MENLFVYGTLMKGMWNHNFIEKEKYIGDGKLINYGLYSVRTFPGIKEKTGAMVKGELYKISSKTLKKIDKLEREGSLYSRKYVKLYHEGKITKAHIYVWNSAVNSKDYVPYNVMPWEKV